MSLKMMKKIIHKVIIEPLTERGWELLDEPEKNENTIHHHRREYLSDWFLMTSPLDRKLNPENTFVYVFFRDETTFRVEYDIRAPEYNWRGYIRALEVNLGSPKLEERILSLHEKQQHRIDLAKKKFEKLRIKEEKQKKIREKVAKEAEKGDKSIKTVTPDDAKELFKVAQEDLIDTIGLSEDVVIPFCEKRYPGEVESVDDRDAYMMSCEEFIMKKECYADFFNFNKYINKAFWRMFKYLKGDEEVFNEEDDD